MPLIWRMSYHATNSSHVTDHFFSTLLSLRYMCCVACCWKSRLTPAVLSEGASCRVALYSGRTHGMLAYFMVHLYIAVVCKWPHSVHSYGEALADCIVSGYFVWYHILSIVFSYGCIVPSLVLRKPKLSQSPRSRLYRKHIQTIAEDIPFCAALVCRER